MAELYTKQAKNALLWAGKSARQSGQNYIGTEHILIGLLKEKEGTAGMVLAEYGVEEERLLSLIDRLITPTGTTALAEEPGYTPRAEKVLKNSGEEADHFGSRTIGTEHILIGMLREPDCVGTRLLYTMGINIQRLYAGVLAAMGEEQGREELPGQQGRNAEAGTPTLDTYSRDLTEMARQGKLDPVVGREQEIDRIIQILSRRTKNNPCLIGEPGVGKTAITEGLAQRIAWGLVPDTIKNKRVVVLDLSGMVAGSKYRGEFEERIKKVVREVMDNQNVLLFIDEIHTIIGAGGAEGALDASNILKPSLSRGEIQLIGATTIEEYRKYIEKDAALERRFQPVMVEEPTEEQAREILKGLRPYYEKHHGVEITDEALEAAVKMSVRYIHDRFLPDKAIDLIDEASSRVQLGGYRVPDHILSAEKELKLVMQEKEDAIKDGDLDTARKCQERQTQIRKELKTARDKFEKRCRGKKLQVTEESISQIVAGWTKIPVEKIAEGESRRLARLEQTLHKRVVGQEEAVAAVARAIRRGRVGLKDPNRPIGSFLFLGPTGVGKTELSKALAEAVFGDEQAMIRVDMSEYMEKHSVSKLIGSPPGYVGYEEGGQLSEKVRRNPYSVILLDEIEKAHPDVFNILLQVLDDGHITDSQGRRVDFKETCIIMTSNAGAQSIVEPKKLGFLSQDDEKRDYEYMKGQVMEEVRRMFKPEFLNRIDETIVFHALTKENMKKIIQILLRDLEKRCREQMNIHLKVSDRAREHLIDSSYDSKYGARPLKRAIQAQIEDPLAEKILLGEIKKGDTVTAGISRQKIVFKNS
ncbi:MAG TPA: ATP-dependent Clp protease ATP-binding subunit [Candidatus Scatomonas pullistercoris]|uniref:ATP-dependent Clp protease ATP-binding subunit n=1 Tax=Candidatus Scatomonas pullistercoris TaxID=2840920 RepID=A0A9D1TAN0_9FIRM|nr:ATP-dependent Clp protease ATP-binding subunit [Candidatus Scatomonas pullistercoris]